MSELPYMPEHVHDLMAETASLTNEELGAFMRLRWALWDAGGYLPQNQIRKVAQCSARVWTAIGRTIEARLTFGNETASLSSLSDLLTRTRERRASMAERAARAAAVRWDKERNENKAAPMLGAFLKQSNQNQNDSESKNLSGPSLSADKRSELAADTALYEKGMALLMERGAFRAMAARVQLYRWLGAFDKAAELFPILDGVERENLRGPEMVHVINQRVQAAKIERERGSTLPFPPNAIKSAQ